MAARTGRTVFWVATILATLWIGTNWDAFVSFLNRGWGVMPEIKERIFRGERYTRGQ